MSSKTTLEDYWTSLKECLADEGCDLSEPELELRKDFFYAGAASFNFLYQNIAKMDISNEEKVEKYSRLVAEIEAQMRISKLN